MNQAAVLPDQLMNGAAADMTALQGDVLEVLAGLDEPFGPGIAPHLDTTSEVEISHERAGGRDDLDERIGRDVPIEGRGIEVPPELAVETEAVPGPTDDGTSDNLTGFETAKDMGGQLVRQARPTVYLVHLLRRRRDLRPRRRRGQRPRHGCGPVDGERLEVGGQPGGGNGTSGRRPLDISP